LLNLGLIPFFPVTVYLAHILIVPGIAALSRKVTARNREEMKQTAVVGIGSSWNHQRNGTVHIFDLADVETRSVVDFEIARKADGLERGNYQKSNDGMEMETMRRMVNR
jgi:hypothetical protein